MKKIYITGIVVVMIMTGCRGTPDVRIETVQELFKISLPSLVSDIDDSTFCLMNERRAEILMVNKNSKSIMKRIKFSKGEGPGEIHPFGLRGIYVHGGKIFIYDYFSNKINVYREDGEYERELLLREKFQRMTGNGDRLVLINGPELIRIMDLNGNVIKKTGKPIMMENHNIPEDIVMTVHDHILYLTPVVNYEIYGYNIDTGEKVFHYLPPGKLKGKMKIVRRENSVFLAPIKGVSSILRIGKYLLVYRFAVSRSGSKAEYDIIDIDRKRIKTIKAKKLCFFTGSYGEDKFFFYDTEDGKIKIGRLKH